MALPKTSTLRQKGFTVFELLITLTIMITLGSLGIFISIHAYQNYLISSEQSLVLNLLRSARNRSLNNLNQSAHGLHIDQAAYVLFQGTTYDEKDSNNQSFPVAAGINNNGPINVSFAPGSATLTSPITINLQNANHTRTISINQEGGINW